MYTNKDLEIINDNAPYTDSDGTKYPRNFPKDEIAELHKVTETERPVGELVVEGFHIDESYNQVWDVREKTQEELDNDIDRFNAKIDRELEQADIGIIRAFINSLDGDEYAIAKVAQHKIDQEAKRLTRKTKGD